RALAIKATTGSFTERGSAIRELDIMVRQATGVAKAKAVAQFTRLLVEAGESVLLVGWHRAVYEIWQEELKDLSPAMYTGSESASQKNREKDRFLSGETSVLIMSLRSGAGLDGLQHKCSVVVFGELDWSPGIHQQVIWRVDREGQNAPVTVFFLVVEDGSDGPIMEILGLKASEAHQIVDPFTGPEMADRDNSRLQALVQRYLGKHLEKQNLQLALTELEP
ncbi:putative helicase, partial [Acidithiobacillus sp. GGI-221]